jgi:pyridoxal phosphate enzyme (YggS family)
MSIADNIYSVKSRIDTAARRCDRDPSSIKLIAVSKTRPAGDILAAVKAGQLAFGENYAQELRDKSKQISDLLQTPNSELRTPNLEWHFIGHLQKNKIKYVLPVAGWIHTIDSAELLNAINSKIPPHPPLEKGGRGGFINCLIEVNIAGEANKSGISPENAFELVEHFSKLRAPHSEPALKGLMCMPPFSDNPETSRPYFKKLKNLLDEINSRSIYPEVLTELSMGMTQDFEIAIEEGATMLRIGTAIFGERG